MDAGWSWKLQFNATTFLLGIISCILAQATLLMINGHQAPAHGACLDGFDKAFTVPRPPPPPPVHSQGPLFFADSPAHIQCFCPLVCALIFATFIPRPRPQSKLECSSLLSFIYPLLFFFNIDISPFRGPLRALCCWQWSGDKCIRGGCNENCGVVECQTAEARASCRQGLSSLVFQDSTSDTFTPIGQ